MERWQILRALLNGVKRREIRTGNWGEPVVPVIIEQYQREKIGVIIPTDRKWPKLLRAIPDPPVELFVRGKLKNSQKLMAVVGSRRMSQRGDRALRKIIPRLVEMGIGVVSGLAYGVDTLAHQLTLKYGGYALAVLPTPINAIYPRENLALSEKIMAQGGALISEYPLNSKVATKNFLERNRLVSGLSVATIVIEAAARSGSIATPNFALDQGREVFVVPANEGEVNSEGILALIRDGATPLDRVEDLVL